jgi:hypothetical protein
VTVWSVVVWQVRIEPTHEWNKCSGHQREKKRKASKICHVAGSIVSQDKVNLSLWSLAHLYSLAIRNVHPVKTVWSDGHPALFTD